MQIIKKLAGLALFLALLFVVVEVSYRFYVLGPIALSPVRLNSMNTLMRSEFVKLSDDPDIFFELKPNIQGWHKGVRFWTNSAGYADREYSRAKPDDTYRIAVAGSSWEMPSGVEPDKAWHALLEESLNAQQIHPKIEVINFGVEMYGLREIVGTVRHKVLDWDPDMIFVSVTPYTMSLLWPPSDKQQTLPPRAYPAFQSYTLLALERLMGLSGGAPVSDRERLEETQVTEQAAQLQRAINELGSISEQTGVPVVVVFLGFYPFPDQVKLDIAQQAQRAGIHTLFADGIFPPDFEQMARYQVSMFDRHPNEAGHVLIANYVRNELLKQKLLPVR